MFRLTKAETKFALRMFLEPYKHIRFIFTRKPAFVHPGYWAVGSPGSYAAQLKAGPPAAGPGLGIPFCCELASFAAATALNTHVVSICDLKSLMVILNNHTLPKERTTRANRDKQHMERL